MHGGAAPHFSTASLLFPVLHIALRAATLPSIKEIKRKKKIRKRKSKHQDPPPGLGCTWERPPAPPDPMAYSAPPRHEAAPSSPQVR